MAAAITAAGVTLLSGCGGGTPQAAPTPAATVAPAGAEAAQAAVQNAVAALREARTGRIDANASMSAGRYYTTRSTLGYFDLESDRWESELRTSSNLGTRDGRARNFEADIKGTDGKLFMAVREDPGVRGAWHQFNSDLIDMSADNVSLVYTLDKVRGTKIEVRRNGGSIVTGRVPAIDAVGLLGYSKYIYSHKLTPKRLAGTAKVILHLDGDGRPVRVALAGGDVRFKGKRVPAGLRQIVAASEYKATYRLIGDPVTITLPQDATRVPGLDQALGVL